MMSEKRKSIVKFSTSIVLLLIAYIPTINWMIDRWMAKDSYYGHGFLIPIISLYIIWQRRELLKKSKVSGETTGLWIIVAGLLVHIICAALRVYFISGFSLSI